MSNYFNELDIKQFSNNKLYLSQNIAYSNNQSKVDLELVKVVFIIGGKLYDKSCLIKNIMSTNIKNHDNKLYVDLKHTKPDNFQKLFELNKNYSHFKTNNKKLELYIDSIDHDVFEFKKYINILLNQLSKLDKNQLNKNLFLIISFENINLLKFLYLKLKFLYDIDGKFTKFFEVSGISNKMIDEICKISEVDPKKILQKFNKNTPKTPLLLKAIIYFHKRKIKLPVNKYDIYYKYIYALSGSTTNENKISKQKNKNNFYVASKIAFILLFSKYKYIHTQQKSFDNIIGKNDLDIQLLSEVLHTKLFTKLENETFHFTDEYHIHFLAAHYINNEQIYINILLKNIINFSIFKNRVLPQFETLASCLATIKNDNYFEFLRHSNSDLILNGHLETLSDKQKDSLLKNYLDCLSNKIFNQNIYNLDYLTGTKTENSHKIIKQYLISKNINVPKYLIVEIATICNLWDLKSLIYDLLKKEKDMYLKSKLINYLAISKDKTYISYLHEILNNKKTCVNTKWQIIISLYKIDLNIQNVIKYMESLDFDNILDKENFKFSIEEFISKQSLEDFIILLNWSILNYKSVLYGYLSNFIYKESWRNLLDEDILNLFSKLLLASHEYSFYINKNKTISDTFKSLLEHYPAKRKKLISKIAIITKEHNAHILFSNYSFITDDALWITEKIDNSREHEQLFYIKILKSSKCWEIDYNILNIIFKLCKKYPLMENEFQHLTSNLTKNIGDSYSKKRELDIENISINIFNMNLLEEAILQYASSNSNKPIKHILEITKFYLINSKIPLEEIKHKHKIVCCAYAIIYRFDKNQFNITNSILMNNILIFLYFSKNISKLYLRNEEIEYIMQKSYALEITTFNTTIKNIILAYNHKKIQINIEDHLYGIKIFKNSTLETLMNTIENSISNDSIKKNILSFLVSNNFKPAILLAKSTLNSKTSLSNISKNINIKQILDILFSLLLNNFSFVSKYLLANRLILDKFIYFITNQKQQEIMFDSLDESTLSKLYIFINQWANNINKKNSIQELENKILYKIELFSSANSIKSLKDIKIKTKQKIIQTFINDTSNNINLNINKPLEINEIHKIIKTKELL
jgi:hypothetical protein